MSGNGSDWRVKWRRRVGAALIDGFFEGAARVGKLHPRAKPERHGIEVIRNLSYAERGVAEHRLDVYLPQGRSGPIPTLLYVHGGGFRILSKDTHWIMGLMLARSGIAVFNVNYRLAPKHPFPAALEDCSRALAWVLDRASSFGADPDRLIFAGESAGANLVTALTLSACYERPEPYAKRVFDLNCVPRAIIPYCGVFQVSDLDRLSRRRPDMSTFITDRLTEVGKAYVGTDPERHGSALDLADPVCMLERAEAPDRPLPPCFLPVGTKDPLLDDTRRLAAAWRALGGQCDMKIYPGELHAFHAFVWREQAQRCWRDSYQFLDGHVPDWSPRC
ncbi:MAG: alpha/beta hydrolase [Polyangiaceae bacterium]